MEGPGLVILDGIGGVETTAGDEAADGMEGPGLVILDGIGGVETTVGEEAAATVEGRGEIFLGLEPETLSFPLSRRGGVSIPPLSRRGGVSIPTLSLMRRSGVADSEEEASLGLVDNTSLVVSRMGGGSWSLGSSRNSRE
jgi:hypothetical protein